MQSRDTPQHQWHRIEGLPTTVITAVLQDAEGFVWIGTHVGLARYDGHRVDVFRPADEEPGTLPSAAVNTDALLETEDGTLWIGTQKGLCRRSPTSTRFKCTAEVPQQAGDLGGENVLALAEAYDGNVWVGTENGLYELDPASFKARRVGATSLSHRSVLALATTPDGTLWVGTGRGLAVRTPSSTTFRAVRGLPDDLPVHTLLNTTDGGVWAGTLGRGLFRVADPEGPATGIPVDALSTLTSSRTNSDRAGPDHIVTLRRDPSGQLWIGTWGAGLFRYDPATETATHFEAQVGDDHALPSDGVVALDIGTNGGVWAATWNGLAHLRTRIPYRLLEHDPEDSTSLSHPQVTSLLPASDGKLWVGTFGGGLNRCEPSTGRCRSYRHGPEDASSLCHDIVLDLERDPEGALWIATSGGGMCRFDPRTESFERPPGETALQTAHVYALAFDAAGGIWAGTAETGLFHRGTSGSDSLHRMLDQESVYTLARTQTGELWAGTLGAGLCWTDDGTTFDCLREGAQGLADDWVTALTPAPGGLWTGGVGGLDWVPRDEAPRHILGAKDLVQPHVTCILSVPSGTWVATAGGIVRLDLDSKRVTHDAAAVGLPTRGFLRPACTALGPDMLAFGTERGVVIFEPGEVTTGRPAPTRITGISVDGRAAVPETPAHLVRSFTIEPGQSGPSFRFTTLNYTAPDARRYVYRLDGVDEEWSRPTGHAEVTYPKLPPGRYTFRVRPALQPLAAEATVAIVVRSPIWQRTWFITLALALAVASGVAVYRARVAYLLRIERTRRSIADDLHDDIGSRLGGLALALDVAARTLTGAARTEVRTRADEARALLGDLRDTVWIIDGTGDTLADLADRVRLTAENLLPDAQVIVTTEGDLDRPLNMGTRRHLLFFCREALHNASRHGAPSTMRITFMVNAGKTVMVRIEDDGCGFDVVTGDGRGMGALRRRSEALGGTLRIASAPGEGTTVSLSFNVQDGAITR